MPRSTPYCCRSHDMQRGANIGIRVKLIKVVQKPGKRIVPFKDKRAQFLTSGKQQVNHHSNGVGNDNEPHQFPKRLYIIEQRIEVHPYEVYEPERYIAYGNLSCRNQLFGNTRPTIKLTVPDAARYSTHPQNPIFPLLIC